MARLIPAAFFILNVATLRFPGSWPRSQQQRWLRPQTVRHLHRARLGQAGSPSSSPGTAACPGVVVRPRSPPPRTRHCWNLDPRCCSPVQESRIHFRFQVLQRLPRGPPDGSDRCNRTGPSDCGVSTWKAIDSRSMNRNRPGRSCFLKSNTASARLGPRERSEGAY